jgi:hypothetical protein
MFAMSMAMPMGKEDFVQMSVVVRRRRECVDLKEEESGSMFSKMGLALYTESPTAPCCTRVL